MLLVTNMLLVYVATMDEFSFSTFMFVIFAVFFPPI